MNASGLAGQNAHRRPPTPPYINSISTGEQYANGSSSRALPRQHSQSYARTAAAVTGGGGTGCHGSSVNEKGLLDDNGDGDIEEDTLLDAEGEGEAEAKGNMDIDAEIARAANWSLPSLSLLPNSQNQSPLKTMPLSYSALSARQYHNIHIPSINALVVSAWGESGKRMPMPLPSVATMDHAHAVSREYHASRGRGRVSQMNELEDGFDGDADGVLPERGSGGGGDVEANGEGDENGAEGSGDGSGSGEADAVDTTMKVQD
ncbi:hypothetical protein DFH11DRAFT_316805 [Phellopilus nigrolimitatus]|nr:hypothetical protein DFH11DRAFT_316805 [Phellopilus nigrolimitatus]